MTDNDKSKCNFSLILGLAIYYKNYECPHPAEKDGLCIFHVPKPTIEQMEKMTGLEKRWEYEKNQKFAERFNDLVKDIELNPEITFYDFKGFYFPPMPMI